MATVYLAQDLKLERPVAIKVLKPELAAVLGPARFLREIKLTAQLDHPHILPLLDSGEADGFLFYVMPYVEGESLRERLRRERQLPIDDALQITREVADALSYAHSHNVVHRDIKPENILLAAGHARVADFGVARAIRAAGGEKVTSTGVAVGTPEYMSPEQAGGGQDVDGRSDLYALGCVLYEMLAGQAPFTAATVEAVLRKHLLEPAPSVTVVRATAPGSLAGAIQRAMAKAPADRFSTAAAFRAALQRPSKGLAWRGRGLGWRPRGLTRRAVVALALLLVAAVALGVYGRRLLDAWRTARAVTVVVLPFTNVGGDPANRAFADGLMEVLTSKLTQLEPFFGRPVWVIPASEVRDRRTESASAARREFAATLAVSGSVQRQRDTINLTLNLVDARTLRQVHAAIVRGPVRDLALWQDGIVDRVAGMLDLDMRPPVRRVLEEGGTTEADAYDLYVQGRGYLQGTEGADNARKAADAFQNAVDRDPQFALGYTGMAEAYWRLYSETSDTSWVRLAIAASQRALALNDSIPAVWVTLGLIHNGLGQYANAIADLQHAVALDPSSSEALSNLARAYEGMKLPGKAEATYRRVITAKPYDWTAHNALGRFYVHQSRYEDAAREFLQVTQLNPEGLSGYVNAGAMLFYLDRWDEARRLFERALAIDSTIGTASNNLGTMDFYEGHYRDAARHFQQAVSHRQDYYLYRGNLGDALYWIPGKREQSRDAYRRAIALAEGAYSVNASDTRALSSLVKYHAILGDTTGALEYLRKLTPLVQGDANVMFNIAWSMEVLGHRDAALDWLGRAIKAGYSRKTIEGSPDLRDLRKDPRYRALVAP